MAEALCPKPIKVTEALGLVAATEALHRHGRLELRRVVVLWRTRSYAYAGARGKFVQEWEVIQAEMLDIQQRMQVMTPPEMEAAVAKTDQLKDTILRENSSPVSIAFQEKRAKRVQIEAKREASKKKTKNIEKKKKKDPMQIFRMMKQQLQVASDTQVCRDAIKAFIANSKAMAKNVTVVRIEVGTENIDEDRHQSESAMCAEISYQTNISKVLQIMRDKLEKVEKEAEVLHNKTEVEFRAIIKRKEEDICLEREAKERCEENARQAAAREAAGRATCERQLRDWNEEAAERKKVVEGREEDVIAEHKACVKHLKVLHYWQTSSRTVEARALKCLVYWRGCALLAIAKAEKEESDKTALADACNTHNTNTRRLQTTAIKQMVTGLAVMTKEAKKNVLFTWRANRCAQLNDAAFKTAGIQALKKCLRRHTQGSKLEKLTLWKSNARTATTVQDHEARMSQESYDRISKLSSSFSERGKMSGVRHMCAVSQRSEHREIRELLRRWCSNLCVEWKDTYRSAVVVHNDALLECEEMHNKERTEMEMKLAKLAVALDDEWNATEALSFSLDATQNALSEERINVDRLQSNMADAEKEAKLLQAKTEADYSAIVGCKEQEIKEEREARERCEQDATKYARETAARGAAEREDWDRAMKELRESLESRLSESELLCERLKAEHGAAIQRLEDKLDSERTCRERGEVDGRERSEMHAKERAHTEIIWSQEREILERTQRETHEAAEVAQQVMLRRNRERGVKIITKMRIRYNNRVTVFRLLNWKHSVRVENARRRCVLIMKQIRGPQLYSQIRGLVSSWRGAMHFDRTAHSEGELKLQSSMKEDAEMREAQLRGELVVSKAKERALKSKLDLLEASISKMQLEIDVIATQPPRGIRYFVSKVGDA